MNESPDLSEADEKLQEMTLAENVNSAEDTELEITNPSLLNLNLIRNLDQTKHWSETDFDTVIGHLEDMLIDEDFLTLQNSFLERYWIEFENDEENKHSYMEIFNEYTDKIEDFIVSYLQSRITDFSMELFISELEEKKESLEGEIFEVLVTLYDFFAFKQMFLDYRKMKEGRTVGLEKSLSVSSIPI